MNAQKVLETDFSDIFSNLNSGLELQNTPVKMNMAIDVGTSKTSALAFRSDSDSVSANQIIKLPNEYAILNDLDVADLSKLDFEEQTFMNMICIELKNITNMKSPLYAKPITISKGMLNDKLLKNSNYSVSNTAKYQQVEEFVINSCSIVVAGIFTHVEHFLRQGDIESAQKALNVELNLAYMLPDEEKLEGMSKNLYEALQGTIEFRLPMIHNLKGRFTIRNNAPRQWLDLYGEAESVIYYFLTKNPQERFLKAFRNHGVAVVDVGEGSVDIVFFKERELMARASSTSREVNGLTIINRTIKNIRDDASKQGKFIKPTVDSVKSVLENNPEGLSLETPTGDYDISGSLTLAKKEVASEVANIFKNIFEQNTVLGVDRLFLVILAGRTMTGSEKSPSMGVFLADRLSEQLMIPADICKVTHPDSNLIGSALKLLMKMKKFRQQ